MTVPGMKQPPHVKRGDAVECFWCSSTLCHSCRGVGVPDGAACGGWHGRLCAQAATRDHLLPRTVEKSRLHYSKKNPAPSVIACQSCNQRRGSMTIAEWMARREDKREIERLNWMLDWWEKWAGVSG